MSPVEAAPLVAQVGPAASAPGATAPGTPAAPPSADPSQDFQAALDRALQRGARVVDVPPLAPDTVALPDIGAGVKNMAKSFAGHLHEHMTTGLKQMINADPMSPTYAEDLVAYQIRGAINHLEFVVTSKIASQMSKSLDTLMRSS